MRYIIKRVIYIDIYLLLNFLDRIFYTLICYQKTNYEEKFWIYTLDLPIWKIFLFIE